MKRLEDLPEIANRQLAGLGATAQLEGKIKRAAASAPIRRIRWQPVLASCAAVALCLCIGLWALPAAREKSVPDGPVPSTGVIGSRSAGDAAGGEQLGTARAMVGVPDGSISVSYGSGAAPSYRSILEPEANGNFPLILVDGAAYRMLTTPAGLSESLLGDSLGQVTEYTLEPALSNGGVVSNTVSAGETVYAVSGMKGAMAAAKVNGTLRAFQRVSYAGTGIVGNETLKDTLTDASHVTKLELSDVGVIDNADEARTLMQTLLDNAVYTGASGSNARQSLLISLDNGLTLQLLAGDDAVSACGTWSCPEFFEAFAGDAQGK